MNTDISLCDTVYPTIQEINGIPGTWLLNDILSPFEADMFIHNIDYNEVIDTTDILHDGYEASVHRVSLRYKGDMPVLASDMYKRLQGIAPSELVFNEEDPELGAFLTGKWDFHSVNERISFLKYEPGGTFSRHRDGIFIRHEDLRSMISLLVYLNDDYVEGRTKAFSDNGDFEIDIQPAVGAGFMMMQRVLHEGGVVKQGVKYVIRFDLLYYRHNHLDRQIQDKNQLAAQYLSIAQDLERSHQGMEAIKYYQLAFKLNPKLEQML